MEKKNEVEVIISGKVYKLIAKESEDYIQRIATYINKKISEIYATKKNPTINQQFDSMFVSINIVDDYLKSEDKNIEILEETNELKKQIDNYFREKTRLESENYLLKQKVKLLQQELDNTKEKLTTVEKEFNIFLDEFDKDENRKVHKRK